DRSTNALCGNRIARSLMTQFDDDDIDDRELPDPSDMDDEDDDEIDIGDPCPNCKKAVFEDAQRCPHCGHFITREGKQPWILVGAAICLLVVIVVWMYFWGAWG
ncbi:MAG TPA: hypothetical protein VMD30_09730, partial [Tepidisphaeraceae bacterium]|nr:hypothetical protein [Tepidisphaeraceae bacterium]